jgi:hypothetical protein
VDDGRIMGDEAEEADRSGTLEGPVARPSHMAYRVNSGTPAVQGPYERVQSYFFFFFVILGVELRVSCLLGRHFTT